MPYVCDVELSEYYMSSKVMQYLTLHTIPGALSTAAASVSIMGVASVKRWWKRCERRSVRSDVRCVEILPWRPAEIGERGRGVRVEEVTWVSFQLTVDVIFFPILLKHTYMNWACAKWLHVMYLNFHSVLTDYTWYGDKFIFNSEVWKLTDRLLAIMSSKCPACQKTVYFGK